MTKLSIIIPSFHEPYLNKTIRNILKQSKGDIEVLVHIDGEIPKRIPKDPRVKYIHHQKPIGMRGGINACLRIAKGKYIMKTDAHCAFAKRFDKVLKRECKKNWLIIPRRYALNALGWKRELRMPIKDYHYLSYPQSYQNHTFCMVPADWRKRTYERIRDQRYRIDDTMTFQGSCWFAHRSYFMKNVGLLDDNKYGSFGGEQVEIGLKYWLGGGKVKVNKNTWYAHLFKNHKYYSENKASIKNKKNLIKAARYEWIAKHWTNDRQPKMMYKFAWLVEKFWPVPGWPEDRKLWKV